VTEKSKDDRWDTEFGRFVEAYGVRLLAARLEVRTSAIYHWLRGSTSPHPANAIKIQKLAKLGRVELSLDQIYEHFSRVKGERYTPASLRPKFDAEPEREPHERLEIIRDELVSRFAGRVAADQIADACGALERRLRRPQYLAQPAVSSTASSLRQI